jgi:DNA-3-methyladenine glycosylase II
MKRGGRFNFARRNVLSPIAQETDLTEIKTSAQMPTEFEGRNWGRNLRAELRAGMVGRIITSEACVAEGAAWLADLEPRFQFALNETGTLPTRLRKDGFDQLLSAIVSQQVSVAAARAIWKRMQAAKLTGPRKVIWASEEDLRAVGLSRQKVRYAKALAEARIDFKGLRDKPTDDVVQILTEVSGIGVWTAEIYAMFSLGRADVFAPGDLALQESARLLFDLDKRPTEKQLRVMAEAWSPWRSVAARLLWAYYHVAKQREGIT